MSRICRHDQTHYITINMSLLRADSTLLPHTPAFAHPQNHGITTAPVSALMCSRHVCVWPLVNLDRWIWSSTWLRDYLQDVLARLELLAHLVRIQVHGWICTVGCLRIHHAVARPIDSFSPHLYPSTWSKMLQARQVRALKCTSDFRQYPCTHSITLPPFTSLI